MCDAEAAVLLRLRLWRCAARAGVSVRACVLRCGVYGLVCVCVVGMLCARSRPGAKGQRGQSQKHTPKQNKQTNTKQKHTQRGGRPVHCDWMARYVHRGTLWLVVGAARKRPRKRAKTRNHHRERQLYSCVLWICCFQKRSTTSIGSGNVPPHHTLAHTACTHVGPMEERLATTCVCRRGSEGTDLAGHHQPTTEPLDAYFFEK